MGMRRTIEMRVELRLRMRKRIQRMLRLRLEVGMEWMIGLGMQRRIRLRMKVMIGLGMKRMIELMLGNEREKRLGMMDDGLPILASTEMSGVFGITTRAKSRSLQAVQTSVAFEIKFVSVHRVKEEAQLGG